MEALRREHPEITTVVQNVNDRTDSLVLGSKYQVLWGKGYIVDRLCGCSFKISPGSFYQVNPIQAQKLYEKAIELADLTGKETVVDAYCGTGTIGMIAAKKAGKVFGVESQPGCSAGRGRQCESKRCEKHPVLQRGCRAFFAELLQLTTCRSMLF